MGGGGRVITKAGLGYREAVLQKVRQQRRGATVSKIQLFDRGCLQG
jgi:hypothetical protein